MQEPAYPADEAYRVSTLRGLNLLETPAEDRFDRLTRVAQRLFDTPIALISLADSDRLWFKSVIGMNICEISRPESFCGHTILEADMLVAEDTRQDPRFAENPFVVGAPHIRFYAGKPIRAANGQTLGSICVLDYRPREFDAADRRLLDDLGELVEKEINLPDWKTLNNRLRYSEQELLESLSQLRDNERHERSRNKSLELISRGYPLHEVLGSIAFEIEQHNKHTIACIELGDAGSEHPDRYWGKRKLPEDTSGVWNCRAEPIKSTNGEMLGTLTTVRQVPGSEAEIQLVAESAILASIAVERDQADRMIWKQANYDALTGLPNRNLLRERLGQELNKARRHRLELGLMFIDLDHFKQVNDQLGHLCGDELLAQVGARLKACMRDSDTVARLGGDEFTVVAVELDKSSDVERVARKILNELSREFRFEQESIQLSASIGIAFYPDHGDDMDLLIQSADRAMYDAKNSGGNRFTIHND